MNISKHMYNWDFKFKKDYVFNSQIDWNKTIIHKLIEFVEKFNITDEPIEIESPKKFLEIFESIVFFDKKTGMLGNRFKIIFHNDNLDNFLRLEKGKKKFLIKNFNTEKNKISIKNGLDRYKY